MLFTCIKSWFFRNYLANFLQISHWSFCWNVTDSLFKWSCSIDCQAHIFFFKTKNCSNYDIFISCDDRIGKMLHNICMSAVAISLRWANHGLWASCLTSLKVLGWLKPNYMWSLCEMWNESLCVAKMANMPVYIYGKNPLKILFSERRWPWNLVCRIGDSGLTNFVQMMSLGLP